MNSYSTQLWQKQEKSQSSVTESNVWRKGLECETWIQLKVSDREIEKREGRTRTELLAIESMNHDHFFPPSSSLSVHPRVTREGRITQEGIFRRCIKRQGVTDLKQYNWRRRTFDNKRYQQRLTLEREKQVKKRLNLKAPITSSCMKTGKRLSSKCILCSTFLELSRAWRPCQGILRETPRMFIDTRRTKHESSQGMEFSWKKHIFFEEFEKRCEGYFETEFNEHRLSKQQIRHLSKVSVTHKKNRTIGIIGTATEIFLSCLVLS
jgi:hypothetical protein